jgi:hypothetical protein
VAAIGEQLVLLESETSKLEARLDRLFSTEVARDGSPADQGCGSARGFATRRRSFGVREPVQLALSVKILCLRSRRSARVGRAMSVHQWRDDGIVPLICPTCQNVFAARYVRASDRQAIFAWGCFRFFDWERAVPTLRPSFPMMIAGR